MDSINFIKNKKGINQETILNLLAIVTVGLPFISFKFLMGLVFLKMQHYLHWELVGIILVAWAVLDLLINLSNFASLFLKSKYFVDVCLLTMIFDRWKRNKENRNGWKDFGTSLDVMLSFLLVAAMVSGNLSDYLPPWGKTIWNVCVVISVLGAGLTRMIFSLMKVRSK